MMIILSYFNSILNDALHVKYTVQEFNLYVNTYFKKHALLKNKQRKLN